MSSRRGNFRNRPCHYCGYPAECLGSIVPKGFVRSGGNPGVLNFLATCSRCQRIKGPNRSACACTACTTAWSVIWDGFLSAPVIDVATIAETMDTGRPPSVPEFRNSVTDGGRRWYFADFGGISSLVRLRGTSCHYCGDGKERMTTEHVVPKSLGGPWWPENLTVACNACNTARGNENKDHPGCGFCARAREMYPAQSVVAASPLTPGT